MKRLNKTTANLTLTAIKGLHIPKAGREEIRDTVVDGLSIRITSTGAKSWSVFRRVKGGEPVRITIGSATAITPTVARIEAKKIISGLALGIAPVKRPSVKAKADASRERKMHTLEALALAYVDFQKARGRISYRDAQNIFKNHLIERAPKLSSTPAADVTAVEISDLLREVKEAGKDRTANKLRSYLSAAYSIAIKSATSHEYPVAFKGFGVKLNPVADTERDKSADRADKNPLKLPELRAYWRAIENAPGVDAAILRLHLLTGGQRIEQLARLRKQDVSPVEIEIPDAQDSGRIAYTVSTEAITLHDSKGRDNVEREHGIPLTARARAALAELNTGREFLVSRSGSKPIDASGLSRAAQKFATSEDFQLKRIRSGVETLLSARRVSKETRGRLQSHGIAGVQDKNYNGHDFMAEKLEALQLLEAALTSTDAKVIEIRAVAK